MILLTSAASIKEYECLVNGDHNHKPLLKFYINLNSVHEERWILQKPETEEPKVFNIIRKTMKGNSSVGFEMNTLSTVSRTIASDMAYVLELFHFLELYEVFIYYIILQ